MGVAHFAARSERDSWLGAGLALESRTEDLDFGRGGVKNRSARAANDTERVGEARGFLQRRRRLGHEIDLASEPPPSAPALKFAQVFQMQIVWQTRRLKPEKQHRGIFAVIDGCKITAAGSPDRQRADPIYPNTGKAVLALHALCSAREYGKSLDRSCRSTDRFVPAGFHRRRTRASGVEWPRTDRIPVARPPASRWIHRYRRCAIFVPAAFAFIFINDPPHHDEAFVLISAFRSDVEMGDASGGRSWPLHPLFSNRRQCAPEWSGRIRRWSGRRWTKETLPARRSWGSSQPESS